MAAQSDSKGKKSSPRLTSSLSIPSPRTYFESNQCRVRISLRGVENLPLLHSKSTGRPEPTDAYARLTLNGESARTAVMSGALSARWEHDCDFDFGGVHGDTDLLVELFHYDRNSRDVCLGVVSVSLVDIFASSAGQDVEKSFRVLNRDGAVVSGHDGQDCTMTMRFSLVESSETEHSESEEEDVNLPPLRSKLDSNALQPRGGVGLKFKVSCSNQVDLTSDLQFLVFRTQNIFECTQNRARFLNQCVVSNLGAIITTMAPM